MQKPQQILTKILELIEYKEDKDVFIKDFINLCEQQALLDVLSSLPDSKKEEIKQKLLWAKDIERQKAVIVEHVSAEAYKQALRNSSEKLTEDFINTLVPDMTGAQKTKLQNLIDSIQAASG